MQLLKSKKARRWIWGRSLRISVRISDSVAQAEIEQLLTIHIALGSWADEMEDAPMPSAPSGNRGYGGDRGYSSGGGFGSGGFGT